MSKKDEAPEPKANEDIIRITMKPFEYTPPFKYLEEAAANESEVATGPFADDANAEIAKVLRAIANRNGMGPSKSS